MLCCPMVVAAKACLTPEQVGAPGPGCAASSVGEVVRSCLCSVFLSCAVGPCACPVGWAGEGEGSKAPVGTLVLTPRPESDLSNAGPDPSDQT